MSGSENKVNCSREANLLSEPLPEADSSSSLQRRVSLVSPGSSPLPSRQQTHLVSEGQVSPFEDRFRNSILSRSLSVFDSKDQHQQDEQGHYTSVPGNDDADFALLGSKDTREYQQYESPSHLKHLFTESFEFHAVSVALLLTNTGVIGMEAAFITQEDLKPVFTFVEAIFTILYVIEVGWRILENGSWQFFIGFHWYWNWFDLIVTAMGVLEFLISLLSSNTAVKAMGKFFRMLRILRLFRALRFLQEVDYVLATAGKATLKLCCLVSFVVFVSAIITTHRLWDSTDTEVQEMFGNLGSSMWSLFKLMTLDGWVVIADEVLMDKPDMIVFFVLFVFVASIALMSLVPAIFIELNMAAREKEEHKRKDAYEQAVREKRTRVLHRLFVLTDTDGSGEVSQTELEVALSNSEIIDQLKSAGLLEEGDLRDVKLGLSDMFEEQIEEHGNPDVELTLKAFIDGFLKVKEATNSQVWRSVTATRVDFRNLARTTSTGFQELQSEIKDLRAEVHKVDTHGLYELMHCVLDEVQGVRETLHQHDKVVEDAHRRESLVSEELQATKLELEQERKSCEEAEDRARLASIRIGQIQTELDASKAALQKAVDVASESTWQSLKDAASQAENGMRGAQEELRQSRNLVDQLRSREEALEEDVKRLTYQSDSASQHSEALRAATLNFQASERERRRLQKRLDQGLSDSNAEGAQRKASKLGTADDAAGFNRKQEAATGIYGGTLPPWWTSDDQRTKA